MCPFVAGRTDGIGEANRIPPLRTWARSVSKSTSTMATNSQSRTKLRNGSSKT